MSNLQAVKCKPIRRAVPGSIKRQEFESVRHGRANLLMFLVVHSGRMQARCLECKDVKHHTQKLQQFQYHHLHLRGVFFIQDGDPTRTWRQLPKTI